MTSNGFKEIKPIFKQIYPDKRQRPMRTSKSLSRYKPPVIKGPKPPSLPSFKI